MKWYHNKITGQRYKSEKYYRESKMKEYVAEYVEAKMEWFDGDGYYADPTYGDEEKHPTPTPPSNEEVSTEVQEHFDNELFEDN